jgi:UDP-glucose 4-epimerase
MHRILVTGGAGFIGRHLVNRLLQLGNYHITVVDDLSNSDSGKISEKTTFYQQDIRNKKEVARIIECEKIECCIHLAARISVVKSTVDPEDTLSVNVDGTLALLEACSERVKTFIFASSAAVYGPPKGLPISENHPLEPASIYGASKVAGEALVSAFKNSNKIPKAVILRFFNVYGRDQRPEYAGVITKFLEYISKGKTPVIFGDGNQTRDFISVDDIVEAVILAINSKKSGLFNVGTGKPVSVNQLARLMLQINGSDLLPSYRPSISSEILHSYANVEKLQKELGFKVQKELKTELQRLLQSA